MRQGLEAYLTGALGTHRVVREHTRKHGDACVLEVADATGGRWVAKRHAKLDPWRREERAYRRWTPALADRAPVLHSADEATRTLVVSKVPGRPARDTRAVYTQAGHLLRALHGSARARPFPDFAAYTSRRLDALLERGAALFDQQEMDFARAAIRSLDELPIPSSVPCHLDYASHNWLVDRRGTVRAIDFAGARRHVWVRDLVRMQFGAWWDRPDLRDAFFDGYGVGLSDDEAHLLLRIGALTAVSRVVWGAEHRLPQVTADGRRVLARLLADGRLS